MKEGKEPTTNVQDFYTTNQLIDRAAELYEGRVLTVSQITTGLRHGHISFTKLGNARLYPRAAADQWLEAWVQPARVDDTKLRVRHVMSGPKKDEEPEEEDQE